MRKIFSVSVLASVVLLSACASRYPSHAQGPYSSSYPGNNYPGQYQNQYPNQYQNQYPQQYNNYNNYVDYAVVVGMREVQVSQGSSGAGAVVGAILGGVLGHQVGKGTGRDLATVGGAIAGAAVGNEMERNNNPVAKLELTVRMSGGEQRTILVDRNQYYRVGDRVRMVQHNGNWQLAQ